MAVLPIVAHGSVRPPPATVARAERLAEGLLAESRSLRRDRSLAALAPDRIEAAPTLHLDDLGEINRVDRFYPMTFLQDRARLRADTGDVVATCTPADPAYAEYCERRLGLGRPVWIHPRPSGDALRVATACWTDRAVREELLGWLKSGRLRYLHPNMGTSAVWSLAALLTRASGKRLPVVAPPPGLTRAVNDKAWFVEVVRRLLGDRFASDLVPVDNLAALAHVVARACRHANHVVMKLPDSAGSAGNAVLRSAELRDLPLGALRARLREETRELQWQAGERLLVGRWKSAVCCAPSSQLWIPPEAEGLPVLEGLFEQVIEGSLGRFCGALPVPEPSPILAELGEVSWLLARTFQRLGYVGRCSFDAIVVEDEVAPSRLELIECNGRWGGASTPMTLINRLFGDWQAQPFATRTCRQAGLERLLFEDLLEGFGRDLFDARSGCGMFIFYGPGRLQSMGAIDVVALGESWAEANRHTTVEIPARLRGLARSRASSSSRSRWLDRHLPR